MNDSFLLNHAMQKIWSSPFQDLQMVINPHRLTDELGAKDYFTLAWLTFPMPSTDSNYHLYQIGRLHPALVGMLPVRQTWTSASAQCNVQGMIIDVYTEKGIKLPLFDVFFRVTANSNLIIAVRDQGRILNVPSSRLSVRFYSNAYFESPSNLLNKLPQSFFTVPVGGLWSFPDDLRSNANPGDILVQGMRVRQRSDVLAFDQKVAAIRALGFGGVTCFYNGEWVPDFSGYYYTTQRVRRDDWIEFVFDASINKVQTFNVSDLKTFLSEKDGSNKYILQRDTDWTGEIFYKDDFDFYLLAPETTTRRKGRYYYRNVPSAVRMITHQDFSIPVMSVVAYEDLEANFTDVLNWQVMVVYRLSGYSQKRLEHDHSRLNEFFRLPIDKRLRALQGIDSTIPWWRASALEASDLSVLFGERPFSFTTDQVENALGYYGVSALVNPGMIATNLLSDGVTRSATLPVGLQQLATIFEYDSSGFLLGYRTVEGSTLYVTDHADCHYIEGIVGRGGKEQRTFFGTGPHQLDTDWDYGYYKRQKVAGVPVGEWLVADPDDYVVDAQNKAWWNIDGVNWHLVIRSNRDFLLYEIDVDARDGLSIFSIQSIEKNELEPLNFVEDLPFGQFDLFFNKRALVRGIDYTGAWPEFVITNVDWVKPGGLQRLLIRCTGLPDVKDGKPVERLPAEVGFVKYGKLSRNRKYNARTGKVQRYVVRGKVLPRSKLNFSEDTGSVSSPVINGEPYSVEEVVVPIGNFTADSTYNLRDLDVERDGPIESYMGRFFDDTPEPNPNPIAERYRVVSPLMTKLIHDIKHNILQIPTSILPMTQPKLEALIADYLYLLPFDPVNIPMNWDSVQVIPHADEGRITMGVYGYHVIAMVNRIYFGDVLDLSKYVLVDPAWIPETLPPLE